LYTTVAAKKPPTPWGGMCQCLGHWAINKKSKDTLLYQTLKVEEKKVFLFFEFMAQGPRFWRFLPQGVGVFFAATVCYVSK